MYLEVTYSNMQSIILPRDNKHPFNARVITDFLL
jgi:hypothetical protein